MSAESFWINLLRSDSRPAVLGILTYFNTLRFLRSGGTRVSFAG